MVKEKRRRVEEREKGLKDEDENWNEGGEEKLEKRRREMENRRE